MKAALVQQAMPAAIGVQSFTDPVFSADAKALLLFCSRASANDANAAHGALSIGSTDKTRQGAVSASNQDAVATTATAGASRDTRCLAISEFSGNSTAASADLTGVTQPSNGVQINWVEVLAQQLINGLLLGGDDIEVSTITASFTNATAPEIIAVNHQLSGPPDVLIGYSAANSLNTGAGSYVQSLGFYVRATDSYAALAINRPNTQAVQLDGAILTQSWLVAQANIGSTGYRVTVTGLTATQISLRASALCPDGLVLLCLRGKNAPLQAANGIFDTPASPGGFTPVSGMPVSPSVVLWIPTRMTAIGDTSGATDDTAGHSGLGVSVNNRGVTQQACSIETSDDAADPTNANCRTSNTRSILIADVDGSVIFDAAVSAWRDDGLTLNAAVVPATPRKVAYLAFGMPLPIPVHKPRTNTLLRM